MSWLSRRCPPAQAHRPPQEQWTAMPGPAVGCDRSAAVHLGTCRRPRPRGALAAAPTESSRALAGRWRKDSGRRRVPPGGRVDVAEAGSMFSSASRPRRTPSSSRGPAHPGPAPPPGARAGKRWPPQAARFSARRAPAPAWCCWPGWSRLSAAVVVAIIDRRDHASGSWTPTRASTIVEAIFHERRALPGRAISHECSSSAARRRRCALRTGALPQSCT